MSDSLKHGFSTSVRSSRRSGISVFIRRGRSSSFRSKTIETSIPERFEKIVRMYPDRFAVAMDDERMTYESIKSAANRLANVILADRDIGNTPVVVILPRGFSQAIAILAVLKAGKMFLLQDPSSTDEERNHILADAQANCL